MIILNGNPTTDFSFPEIEILSETPTFPEECGHGGFVSSIVTTSNRVIDVYVFEQNGQQSICLRYGNRAHEYISPGTTGDLLFEAIRNRDPIYLGAATILLKRGFIAWHKTE